jgi:hypothetical protein
LGPLPTSPEVLLNDRNGILLIGYVKDDVDSNDGARKNTNAIELCDQTGGINIDHIFLD